MARVAVGTPRPVGTEERAVRGDDVAAQRRLDVHDGTLAGERHAQDALGAVHLAVGVALGGEGDGEHHEHDTEHRDRRPAGHDRGTKQSMLVARRDGRVYHSRGGCADDRRAGTREAPRIPVPDLRRTDSGRWYHERTQSLNLAKVDHGIHASPHPSRRHRRLPDDGRHPARRPRRRGPCAARPAPRGRIRPRRHDRPRRSNASASPAAPAARTSRASRAASPAPPTPIPPAACASRSSSTPTTSPSTGAPASSSASTARPSRRSSSCAATTGASPTGCARSRSPARSPTPRATPPT